LASTSDRRALLKAALAAPLAGLAPPAASAADYTSATEVLEAVDRLEDDVAARLRALSQSAPASRRLAASFLADLERHRAGRAELRRRLRLPPGGVPSEAVSRDASLDGLRAALEALVYAHAEGLPALGDAAAVASLARAMVDLSRQLTVVDLWIEREAERG
jgi:hypothetical protein